MSSRGLVVGVNGNMIDVETNDPIMQNEVAYVIHGDARLKAEVIRIDGHVASLQVYESTRGLQLGDSVEFSQQMLSVTLGPGLLGQIYDGLQNPLPALAEDHGFFLPRGIVAPPLDEQRAWTFTPSVVVGDRVRAGMPLGHVPEGLIKHCIMAPFDMEGDARVEQIADAGDLTPADRVATLRTAAGEVRAVGLNTDWPVKVPITAYREKLMPRETLVTGVRSVDTFFPIAKGGTFCVPGPFGAGKTVLQQIISRFADVDVVIIAACGERAGEVVETLREFPELTDPRTGRSLMERTIIIVNTSSMPVAAREASVYTAATLGEYYRQMGLDVLLLADSTSRWAQAMREVSGRLEEIPGEEAFPAYLESRIAEFYERAGRVELADGAGSLTIGGTVSPAGGNFDEPVTQATLKVVGAFLGLSRERANARRFPAIHPLESWSHYEGLIDSGQIAAVRQLLHRGYEIQQMMTVVGEEGTSNEDFVAYLKAEFIDAVYLQQNAFDAVDAATPSGRQQRVFAQLHILVAGNLEFDNKDGARAFFNQLRQLCIDWNYTAEQDSAFAEIETRVASQIQEHTK